jgi:hypothetical protein
MKSYHEVRQEYGDIKPPYHELLGTVEWSKKRSQIIFRERNTCQSCERSCIDDYTPKAVGHSIFWEPGIYEEVEVEKDHFCRITGEHLCTYSDITLKLVKQEDPHYAHVHHTYYILSSLPWDYPDEDLMLLCHKCHTHFHQTQKVNVYRTEAKLETADLHPCSRCAGTGHLPQYNHVQDGICFKCGGACFDEWVK